MCLTMEFNSKKKQKRWGWYKLVRNEAESKKSIRINLQYNRTIEKYNEMRGEGYRLKSYNCKHWASELYEKLENLHHSQAVY